MSIKINFFQEGLELLPLKMLEIYKKKKNYDDIFHAKPYLDTI